MSSIDERVVEMKFNNSQFAAGVRQTTGMLDSMKKSLNLDAATKSVQGLDAAGKKFSLEGMGAGIEAIKGKFSALSIVGITALTNITNKAVNAGMEMVQAFAIAPITDGFGEYEQKLGSIQTILANTAKQGTKLKDVNAALGELNTYSDKTIYNFGDMTRNIGMFTNAGIGLKDSVAMIKGFSNEAAASGTNAQQASGAAYQLSQAMSKGKVTLEDWRSLTNASMGSNNMKSGLMDIAQAMGTFQAHGTSASAVQKDFNGSLEKGWLTADVMTKYLKIQAGEMTAAQMKTLGLNDAQIKTFQTMQKNSEDAATKVRSFTQLIGTIKEAVGSTWASTFELLIGDFNEATDLFTHVNNVLSPIIQKMGDARNNLIQGWDKLGGRKVLIDTLFKSFDSLMGVIKVVSDAFKEVFPPTTAKDLMNITVAFQKFMLGLRPGKQQLDEIKRIFKGVFSILDIGVTVIKAAAGMFGKLFGSATQGSGGFLTMLAKVGDWFTGLDQAIKKGDNINKFFSGLGDVLQKVVDGIKGAVTWIGSLFQGLDKVSTSGAADTIKRVSDRVEPLKGVGENISRIWDGVAKAFEAVSNFFAPLATRLATFFGDFGKMIADNMKNVNFNTVLDTINTGLFAGLVLIIKKFLKGGMPEINIGGGVFDSIKKAFGGLTDTLGAMQANLKAGTLLKIAGAIALLTVSVVALSLIDSDKLTKALMAMTVMFTQLFVSMGVFEKMTRGGGFAKMPLVTLSMILLAIAIDILASAVKKMSGLSWEELLKGLAGVTGLLLGIAGAVKLMSGVQGKLISAGLGMIAIAFAIKILVSAVQDFSKMSWDEISRGLVGVGTLLGSLAIFTRLAKVNKGAIGQGVGLILLGASLKILASATKDFADMNPSTLQQGLGAIIGVLGALAIFTRVSDPKGIMATGTAMVVLGGALKILVTVVSDFAAMNWETLGRGMAGMAGALFIIAIAMNQMPYDMPALAFSLVLVAGALKVLASALNDMGGMSWEEIAKGLVTLAAALAIIAGAMYLMEFAMPGAQALIVVAAALAVITPVLLALAGLGWEGIIQGLVGLAGVFAVIGLAGLILEPVIPAIFALGVSVGLLGAGMALAGLGILAFSAGLLALSVAGAAGTAALVAIVSGLLGLIPMAFTQIALGIVAFAKVLGDAVPVFVQAAVKLMLGILQAINTVAPQIIFTLMNLIFLLVNALVVAIPRFVNAGMRLVIGILNGIGNNIGKVVDAGMNIIIQFLNGVARNIPKLARAAADVIIALVRAISNEGVRIADAAGEAIVKFVNGLTAAIKKHSGELKTAAGDLAFAIIDGMTGGLASKAQDVWNAAVDIGNKAISAIQHAIDSNSPSKESHKLGNYVSWGFANGITALGNRVHTAATGVGNTALDAMKSTISGIGKNLDANMSMNPTIRPVLDLSAVRSDASRIGGILQPNALVATSSYANAASISDATSVQNESTSKTGAVPAAGVNLTLNQYNTSPKALSPAEMYRETNNALSVTKGALKKIVDQN